MAEGVILDNHPKAPVLVFEPGGDRYLVRAEDPDQFMSRKHKDIILHGYTEKTLGWKAGVVLEVGDGHLLEHEEQVTMLYKPGDTVMIYHNAGHDVLIGGASFCVVSQKEILGRFKLVAEEASNG